MTEDGKEDISWMATQLINDRDMSKIEEPKELTRSFGGKIDGFISSLEEAHEKRHLKAYLKGKKYFRHGFYENKEPMYYDVIENWK